MRTRQTLRNDDALVEVLGTALGEILRECEARIEEAMAAFAFKGQWTENIIYKRRNLVSMGGAIHMCVADQTATRPGVGSDWTLLVPKPRDGRDGKDYVPPEPPPVRTARSHRS